MEMDEKKQRKKRTNSSSLIPEQSSHTVSERRMRAFWESLEDKWSKFQESESQRTAPRAIPLVILIPPSKPLAPSVPVKSESSMSEPPDSHLQKTQRQRTAPSAAPLVILIPPSQCTAPSAASEKIHAVMPQPVRPLSRVSPSVSVNSYSSMNQLPSFHLQKTQSEPLRKTDSPAPSVSMKSDSSMDRPINFNPQKKQSCSVCGQERCLCSFWDQYSSTAGYSFERSERDQELQSVLLKKTIKRVEMETEKSQAEKEKAQAEKEKLELEKRKLALEIQLLEQQGKYTNYETKNHGVLIPNKGIPCIPYI